MHATCGHHHRHLSTAKPTASPVPVFRRLAADDGSLPGGKQTKGGVSTGEGRACERDTGDPTTVTSRVIQRDNGEFCWPANLILSGSGGGPQAKICHLSRRLGFQALVLAQDGRVLPDRVRRRESRDALFLEHTHAHTPDQSSTGAPMCRLRIKTNSEPGRRQPTSSRRNPEQPP